MPISKQKTAIAVSAAMLLALPLSACSQPSNTTKNNNQSNTASQAKTQNTNVSGTAAIAGAETITEQQIADYIAQYRMLVDKNTDTEWATFLDESGTSVEKVRDSAIQHFAENIAVNKRASELGIEASDEEVDAVIAQSREDSGFSSDDAGWKAFLEASGYTEESYREDVKMGVLRDKLCSLEAGYREATDPEMLSQAATQPSLYTGKKYVDVSYPGSNTYSAEAFSRQQQQSELGAFMDAAAKEVDEGRANKVEGDKWSCLTSPSAALLETLNATRVGSSSWYVEDDGTAHVVFVVEEFMTKPNGTFSLTEMPQPIFAKLKSDTSLQVRGTLTNAYLSKLVEGLNVDKKPMPSGLPYDVSMDLSEYGMQKTQTEQDEEARQLVENQLDALENANGANQEAVQALEDIKNRAASGENTNGNQ